MLGEHMIRPNVVMETGSKEGGPDLKAKESSLRATKNEPHGPLQLQSTGAVSSATLVGLNHAKAASRFLIPDMSEGSKECAEGSAWAPKLKVPDDGNLSAETAPAPALAAVQGPGGTSASLATALTGSPPSRSSMSPSADRSSTHAEEVTDALRRFELMTEVGALQEGMFALIQERADTRQKLKMKDVEKRKLEEMADAQEQALKEARTKQAYVQEQLNSAKERIRQLEEEQNNALTLVKNTMEADVELQRTVARRDKDIEAKADQLRVLLEENTALKQSNQDLLFKMDHELQRLRTEAQAGTSRITELERLNDEKDGLIQQMSDKLYQSETASLSVQNAYSDVTQQAQEWRAKAELSTREKELLQDEQHRVLAAMQALHTQVNAERSQRAAEKQSDRDRLVNLREASEALQGQVRLPCLPACLPGCVACLSAGDCLQSPSAANPPEPPS